MQNNRSDLLSSWPLFFCVCHHICIELSCENFVGMSPKNCYFGTKINSYNYWAHLLMKSTYIGSSIGSSTLRLYLILPSFCSVFLLSMFFKFPFVKPFDLINIANEIVDSFQIFWESCVIFQGLNGRQIISIEPNFHFRL